MSLLAKKIMKKLGFSFGDGSVAQVWILTAWRGILRTSKHAMSEQSCENSTAHLQKEIFVQSFGIFSFLFFFFLLLLFIIIIIIIIIIVSDKKQW